MPLTDEERTWAESKIAGGASKDQVFGFLADRRAQNSPGTASAAEMGSKLGTALTGQPDATSGFGPLPTQLRSNIAPENQAGAQAIREAQGPTRNQLADMIPQNAGLALAGAAGSELGVAALPRFPLVAGALGSAGTTTAADMFMDAMTGRNPDPAKSLEVGALGGAAELGLGSFGRMAARGGGVANRTIDTTLQRGPLRSTLEAAAGNGVTLGRSGEMFGGMKEAADLRLAEKAKSATGKALSRSSLSPGRQSAEAKMATHTGMVDMAPVKQYILDHALPKSTITPQAQRMADFLGELYDRIPDQMSMKDYDNFLQEMRAPIKAQIGNLDASAPVAAQKGIARSMTKYRDTVVLPSAAADFKAASKYLGDVKNFRNTIVDKSGALKAGAENTWRKALRTPRIREAIQAFDAQTGNNFAERGASLARKQDWTPEDGKMAAGGVEALAGWFGRASVFLSRGTGKLAIAASRPAGRIASVTARQAFEDAMRPNP